MVLANLIDSVAIEFEDSGQYSLSVWSHPSHDAHRIVEAARQLPGSNLPHSQMRLSTAGRLRAAGFELVATDLPGYYSLVLPSPQTDATWRALDGAFDPPQPTPPLR
jgi:hypothetical protein